MGALLPQQSPPSVTKLSPQSTLIALTVTTIHSPQFTLITQMTVGEMTVRLMWMCSGVDDIWGHDSWGGDSSVGGSFGVVTVGAMTGRVKETGWW